MSNDQHPVPKPDGNASKSPQSRSPVSLRPLLMSVPRRVVVLVSALTLAASGCSSSAEEETPQPSVDEAQIPQLCEDTLREGVTQAGAEGFEPEEDSVPQSPGCDIEPEAIEDDLLVVDIDVRFSTPDRHAPNVYGLHRGCDGPSDEGVRQEQELDGFEYCLASDIPGEEGSDSKGIQITGFYVDEEADVDVAARMTVNVAQPSDKEKTVIELVPDTDVKQLSMDAHDAMMHQAMNGLDELKS